MNGEQALKTNVELFTLCKDSEEEGLYKQYLEKIGSCEKCRTADYVSYLLIGYPTKNVADMGIKTKILAFGGCSPKTPMVNQKCRQCHSEFYFKKQ